MIIGPAVLALLCTSPLLPQDQPAQAFFDVASIKPTTGHPINSGFRRASPGSLNATNVSPRFLIAWAYDLREDQVVGGPTWLDSDRYEIVAKPGDTLGTSQKFVRLRTQALLASRFQLSVSRQTKEMPVYALVVLKNGPKNLKPSTAETTDFVDNGHHLSGQRVDMKTFAKMFLAGEFHRTVLDQTGLAGFYDITLDWASNDASADAPYPPLERAIQEQLGLKLEPQKGPVDVLVVEHAERPSEN